MYYNVITCEKRGEQMNCEFPKIISELRKSKGIKQADLAYAVGSTVRTISRIETGERDASLILALKIAKQLEKPVEEVFEDG